MKKSSIYRYKYARVLASLALAALTTPAVLVPRSVAKHAQENRQLQRNPAENLQRRIALVIGNGTYAHAPQLKNPPNDATLVADTLKKLGFEVTVATNRSQREMKQLIREFGQRLRASGGVGLFYFAGHGVQSKGHNYLVPIDADVQSEAELIDTSVDMDYVLTVMYDSQNALNFVILDACRSNPFPSAFRSPQGGLAEVSAPSGTLVAYATAPGKTAADGDKANSPYTEVLAREIEVPNVLIETTFRHVTEQVSARTGGKQEPWVSSNVKGEFYFSGGPTGPRSDAGIYLTRMVNPPDLFARDYQFQKTALWFSAMGNVPYLIDSIRIVHSLGVGEQIKIAAQPAAGNYTFTFNADSTESHVLEPALEVNPKNNREVPFVFNLIPKGFSPTTNDRLEVSVHYHSINGDNGFLSLREPSEEAQVLARLLGTSIEAYDLVVTPNGAIRGNGPYQAKQPKLVYQSLERFPPPYLVVSLVKDDENQAPSVSLTPERLALNAAVEKKGGLKGMLGVESKGGWVSAIMSLITEDRISPYPAGSLILNICSALPSRDCDEAFAEMRNFGDEDEDETDRDAERLENSLTVSHMLRPSARLADFILSFKSLEVRLDPLTDDPASAALALFPAGNWAEALIRLASAKRSPALSGLYLRRAELTEPQRKTVEDLAWKNLDEFAPEADAVKYLIWRAKPLEEIRDKLIDPKKGNREYRLGLNKELLGGKAFYDTRQKPK